MNENEQLKTITQQIEDAHIKLLSIDQQYARVQKLHQAEEGAIAQLQQIKVDLEKAKEDLTSKKDQLTKEVSSLEEKLGSIKTETSKEQDRLASLLADNNSLIEENKKKEDEIFNKAIDISLRESAVIEKEKELREREIVIANKQEKLAQIVNSLK